MFNVILISKHEKISTLGFGDSRGDVFFVKEINRRFDNFNWTINDFKTILLGFLSLRSHHRFENRRSSFQNPFVNLEMRVKFVNK